MVGSGAHVPPLEVRADGTYVWAIDRQTIIRGRWHELQPSERSEGMKGPGIVLLNGEDHKDWAMWRPDRVGTSTSQDVVAMKRTDLGTSYQGTRIR